MIEAAALSFSIDSSQAVSATEALDRMVRRSSDASAAVRTLSETSTQGQTALRDLAQQGVLLDTALRQAGTGIDGVISRVKLLSQEIGTFQATTRDMQTALGQLRAAGELFGTTAAGLDSFARASRSIGQNSFEMAQGLQRIQQALEGTTLAGERARAVLRNYGIEVEGMGRESAGDVQRQFVAALRRAGPDARTNEDIFTVLGPQSVTSMAGIRSESYLTEEQRRRRLEQGTESQTVLRTQIATAERDQRLANTQAERADLFQNYRGFGETWLPGFLRPNDAELRERRDSGERPRSEAFTWSANPDGTATFRGDPRWQERLFNTIMDPMGLMGTTTGVNMFGEGYITGGVRAARERFSSRQFQENARSNWSRYSEEADAAGQLPFFSGGLWARLEANGRFQQRTFDNLFGRQPADMATQEREGQQRTADYRRDTGTLERLGAMSSGEQSMQQQLLAAIQTMSPPGVDLGWARTQTPAEIMASLPMAERSAIQMRFDAQDRVLGQQNDRGRADQSLMRRASMGGLVSADMFGISPGELGLTEDTTTNQEAAERARLIAREIIRIREAFKGEVAQAEELRKVNDQLTADQQARRQTGNDRAAAALDFTRRTAGLVTDVDPANRAQNAAQMAFERYREENPNDPNGAMIAGQRALTEAIIGLERTMNEAVRQSEVALGGAIGSFNAYVGGAAPPRFNGGPTDLGEGGVFQPRALPLGMSRMSLISSEGGAGDGTAMSASAARYNAVAGRAPIGSRFRDAEWARGLAPPNGLLFDADRALGGGMELTASRGPAAVPANDDEGELVQQNGRWVRRLTDDYGQRYDRPATDYAGPTVTANRAPPSTGYVDIPSLQNWTPARSAAEFYQRSSSRTLESAAVAQTNGMANGPERDRVVDNLIEQGAVQSLARMVKAFDEATAAHQNNIEVLRASTSAERELIQARQGAERRAAELRGAAAEARTPEARRQLEALAGRQVPEAERNTREQLGERFEAGLRQQQRNLSDAEAENDNWYMTNEERARARGGRQARRGAQEAGFAFDGPEADRAAAVAGRTSGLQETARQNQQIRDSFLEVGNAATAALSQIILRGGDARQVMKGLLADMAAMMLRRAMLGVVEKGFSMVVGSIAGAGAPGTAGTNAALAAGAADSTGNLLPFAQGGTFTRAFARGEVVNTPTYFPLSDGNRGLVGEAGGSEAILPLKRDSSGNLGVAATGGGGGGHTVNVTVNNSGGGGTSPDQAKNIASLVSKALDEAGRKTLLNEMRVGGSLNSLYG